VAADITKFRRRFVNDQFVDVVAVPQVADFKLDYEEPIRNSLQPGSKLTHVHIDSEWRKDVTPDWVYSLFGISRP
jgi:hypothetical protein